MAHHDWSLGEIAWGLMRGTAQLALDLIPLVSPWPETGAIPGWWWLVNSYWDWDQNRDSRGVPNRYFIECWMRAGWHALGRWIDEVGIDSLSQSVDRVRSWIGYVQHGYVNFQQWLDSLTVRLGSGMVYWAQSVVQGLDKLYGWLPPEIRLGIASWASLLDSVVQRAKSWVQATYNLAISLGGQAWGWVVQTGNRLDGWYQSAHGVLDEFRANPQGFVLARLGPTWDMLRGFALSALPFYVGLWGSHAGDLADFLSDPAGWIYDRLEAYLERLW